MFIIPGQVVTLITFPGVIFHELGHKWFCQWTGVKVHEVCYFRFGNPAGYVIHEKPQSFYQSFLITLGPFITGTLICLLSFGLAKLAAAIHPGVEVLLIWLGGSIAINSFPSPTDANNLWEETNHHIQSSFGAVVGYPFVLFIYVANLLSFFWFDLIYAGTLYNLVNMF